MTTNNLNIADFQSLFNCLTRTCNTIWHFAYQGQAKSTQKKKQLNHDKTSGSNLPPSKIKLKDQLLDRQPFQTLTPENRKP